MPNFTQLLTTLCIAANLSSASHATQATVHFNSQEKLSSPSKHRLLGSNLGLWFTDAEIEKLNASQFLKQWAPATIRFPGGSWSDEIYWNGNGVRSGDQFDTSKRNGDFWQVDYSDWKPGFRINHDRSLHEFHGHTTLPKLHQFAVDNKLEAIVTVNAGTGTPKMAAEWVRWANKKMGYKVKYWEVGNELEGEWEAGHIRPDGSKMDAKKYTAIYLEFAKAMKAVDPNIKVGGPTNSNDSIVFTEELIKQAGEHIDFVSYHTYSVDAKITDTEAIFKGTERVKPTVELIRSWLKKHQPNRADSIEIGITEWHLQVHENQNTCNLLSGLWSARFIGEMFRANVDFANQWDLFSTAHSGGHGLFQKGGPLVPRASYWAMWLWGSQLGDTLITSSVTGSKHLKSYATLHNDKPAILLINQSPTESITTTVKPHAPQWKSGERVEFSHRNYLWNPYEKKPEWTQKPLSSGFDTARPITLPPFSATVLRFGEKSIPKPSPQQTPTPDIFLPKSHPSDLPLTTKVFLRDGASPYLGKPTTLKVRLHGPATLSATSLPMQMPVSDLTITPTGAGPVTLTLTCADQSTQHTFTLKKVALTPKVIWSFGNDADVKVATGNLPTRRNGEARRNEDVLEVTMQNLRPTKGNDLAVEINPLKLPFPKKKIGGICAKIKASPNLLQAPKGAAIQVVIQSEGNHWMVLKEIPIHSLTTNWSDIHITTEKQQELEAMALSYALVFKIKSPKPITGKLFIDDLGFIIRN
ncbi:glycoside hydrolase family 44 protein [Rubritalea tangerina]|uniref:Glycoside hydrolase family 44 protein n=2 Tax=Rubritalea tangerina TaxID=430798 RepID=A0ABW4ZCH0_9BACT